MIDGREGDGVACHALSRAMCSSMYREMGLTGHWRSQASQVHPVLQQK
jgi:hypothetical protein